MNRSKWILLGIGIALLGAGVTLAILVPRLPLSITGGVGSAGVMVMTVAVASSRGLRITVEMGDRPRADGSGW